MPSERNTDHRGARCHGGSMTTYGMNERAWMVVDRCITRAAELGVTVHTLPGGCRVVDAGVKARGGLAAGLALVEICTGGLASAGFTPVTIDGEAWPGVQIWTDHPAISCMASQ